MRNWAWGRDREMRKYAAADPAEPAFRGCLQASLTSTVCLPNINSQRRIEQCLKLLIKVKKAWQASWQDARVARPDLRERERECFARLPTPLFTLPLDSQLLHRSSISMLHKTSAHSANSACLAYSHFLSWSFLLCSA